MISKKIYTGNFVPIQGLPCIFINVLLEVLFNNKNLIIKNKILFYREQGEGSKPYSHNAHGRRCGSNATASTGSDAAHTVHPIWGGLHGSCLPLGGAHNPIRGLLFYILKFVFFNFYLFIINNYYIYYILYIIYIYYMYIYFINI